MAKKYTNKTEDSIAKEISEQYSLSKRYLDNIHERMNQQEELYRSYIDKNNYPTSARVFDPRIFRVIETITPRMVANEPTGSFYPVEAGDVATSQILNALIKYDWRRAEMFPKLVMFVKSMLIFGTAFGRTYWDFRETDKIQMEPKQLNGRTVWTPKNTKKVKVTEFDGPNFEVLNIYDCFPDPNATSLSSMRWFIYRTFKTLDELKNENETRGMEYYKNLDKLEEQINAQKEAEKAGGRPQDMQYREHRRLMLSTEDLTGEDSSNPEFAVLRRFTKEGWCDIVPEFGNVVIREVQNPYFHGELPIIYGVDYPYPGELYGMGEIEPIDRIQRAINAVLNQRLDNVALNLNTMWKVKKTGGVDMHTLVSAPGNIVTTDDMDAVEPFQVPDVTGSTFVQTMGYLTSAMQNGSGITDYTMGIDNQNATVGNSTATGTRLIQQEANAQFKLKIQLFNHMVIQRIANHWKDLRIQYTTEDQKLRIIGQETIDYLVNNTDLASRPADPNDPEPIIPGDPRPSKLEVGGDDFAFLNLLPEDIQPAIVGDYDFIASVSQDQLNDPAVMQENFFLAIDKFRDEAWMQGLAQQGKMLNFENITRKAFEKLNIGVDSKELITDLPQAPMVPGQQDMSAQPMTPEMMDEVLMQAQQQPEAIQNPLNQEVNPLEQQFPA